MKLIGITGGVGAGKSELLQYIGRRGDCRVLKADEAAHLVKQPGTKCHEALVKLLGRQVLAPDGQIDRGRMAAAIFGDGELLRQVNELIHPAVKRYILREVERCRAEGLADYFFIEAALLIEDGYTQIVDELWYIRADDKVRRERLRQSRRYSDEKIERIMASQLTDEEFAGHAQVVIDNSTTLAEAYRQIDAKLGVGK